MKNFNLLSLFSGIGGFDLGFEKAGIHCHSVCELDKAGRTILKKHFPNTEIYKDVHEVGKNTHTRGSVDIVCGGFPCQDVSLLGKRKGLAGERSGLWFEFERIISELVPRWVVVENVTGLLSSEDGHDFARIIFGMVKLGYGVCWRVFNSQHFGVPQSRRRVFIVASSGNGDSAKVLFQKEGDFFDTAVATSREVFPTLIHGYRANNYGAGHPLVYDKVGLRTLVPIECERVQGFPDNWTEGLKDSTRYRLLGNAVPPQFSQWIGERLMEVECG